mmetsp:Transcript_21582/g.35850  ORF Transcript_21582/g.35850 Transcript_21582/m.35850 type:complete len:334 (-) Transcript_21582:1373-2374(-)
MQGGPGQGGPYRTNGNRNRRALVHPDCNRAPAPQHTPVVGSHRTPSETAADRAVPARGIEPAGGHSCSTAARSRSAGSVQPPKKLFAGSNPGSDIAGGQHARPGAGVPVLGQHTRAPKRPLPAVGPPIQRRSTTVNRQPPRSTAGSATRKARRRFLLEQDHEPSPKGQPCLGVPPCIYAVTELRKRAHPRPTRETGRRPATARGTAARGRRPGHCWAATKASARTSTRSHTLSRMARTVATRVSRSAALSPATSCTALTTSRMNASRTPVYHSWALPAVSDSTSACRSTGPSPSPAARLPMLSPKTSRISATSASACTASSGFSSGTRASRTA